MKYRTIVADPPWPVAAGRDMGRYRVVNGHQVWDAAGPSRPLSYAAMAVPEIAALPVCEMAADNCSLYLWTINAYVEDVYGIARAWGFKPSTLCVWAKTPFGGGMGGTFGISTEFFLYARRGSPKDSRATGTWFSWKRHYVNGKPSHSSKPDAFYDLVGSVSPGPYVELFARRARLGWDYWGDQSLQTAEMPAA